MSFGKKLASKGFLKSAISLITKGWLHQQEIDGEVPPFPPPVWCDYPHAVKMATAGRLGAVVGMPTRGVVLRICIEELPVGGRTTGPGMRGFREEEKRKFKVIKISVLAYGKKYVTEHVVDKDINIGISDIEVFDNGKKITGIKVKNFKKWDH